MPRICVNCILPDTVPGITFNAQGICSLCEEHQAGAASPRAATHDGAQGLLTALRGRGRSPWYDCLCLYSGGKDSTFMLYTLAETLKLRVLAVTLDNWFLSPHTFQNIKTTLRKLSGVDHVLLKPSWAMVQAFFQAGFSFAPGTPMGDRAYLMGHACCSCFGLIGIFAGQLALEKRVRHIVVGTTPGQLRQKDIHDLHKRYDSASDALRNLLLPLMREMGSRNPEFRRRFRVGIVDTLRIARLKMVPFYEHVPYDEAHVLRTVEQELGWVRPRDTDSCSTNCQMNALGIQVHRSRYGISPYVIPLAHDVRTGLMTRDEALTAVNGDLNPRIVAHVAEQVGVREVLASELADIDVRNRG